jgi:hypothetical protein
VTDHEDWTAWWNAATGDPALAALIDQRSARAITHHGGHKLSLRQHEALLHAAGFTSTGTAWQTGDDYVLVAIR